MLPGVCPENPSSVLTLPFQILFSQALNIPNALDLGQSAISEVDKKQRDRFK